MAVTYSYGAEEVQAKAAQAGKAQAAKVQLQQQFQKDMAMMDYGFRIQAEQRARAWELEKMEIASRMDFQQQETQRLRENENYQNALNEIDKRVADGVVPPEIAERAKMDAALKHFKADGAAEFLGAYEAQQEMLGLRTRELDLREQEMGIRREAIDARRDPMAELIAQMMGGQGEGQTSQANQVQQMEVAAPQKPTVLGQAALKKYVPLSDIPPADIPQDGRGYFIIANPQTGEVGTVPPRELPEYINMGFVAQPVSGGTWSDLFKASNIKQSYQEQLEATRLAEEAKKQAAANKPSRADLAKKVLEQRFSR